MPSFMSLISYIPSLSPGHSLRSVGHLLQFCVVLLHLQHLLLIVQRPPAILCLCQLRQVVTSNLGLGTIVVVVGAIPGVRTFVLTALIVGLFYLNKWSPVYLDPEYEKCYQNTDKSDVCSFGSNKNGFNSDFKVKRMVTLVAELAFQRLQQEKEIRLSMEALLEALKRIESVDYEALEEEEMSRGFERHFTVHSTLTSSQQNLGRWKSTKETISGQIGYPFWGDQFRPKYCGHSAFELVCPPLSGRDNPFLRIHGYNDSARFEVLGINNSSMTIVLQDFSRAEGLDQCIFPSSNLAEAVTEDLIEYSAKVECINLLYDCKPSMVGGLISLKNFTCSTDDYNNGTTYYWENDKTKDESHKFCQSIQVPVGKDDLKQGKVTLRSVLEKGFEDLSATAKVGIPILIAKNQVDLLPKSILGRTVVIMTCYRWLNFMLMDGCDSRSDLEFGNGIPVFSYTKLQEATNNFDEARKLGHGGFGVVYHGKLRDGREVAVKRLFERDYKGVEQFRNEVEILTALKHPNLVTLYGCTSRHSRELLLVYEYIPNGTVADHLYGDRSESGSLTWSIRMKIAIQTAGALSYLHATEIIHRDVKTNNILLDDNFTVKVADFGISRLFPFDATHVSTAPQGTPGYLDPQHFKCYQVTNKSDVYSFGVVLIQLISSLRAIDVSGDEDEIDLSTYAMNKIQHGKLCELVDQRLGFASDFKVRRMITLVAELACQCLQQEKEKRPSMEEVLEALKRIESVDYEALEGEEMS
ncbi:hypothetical protein Cgig2_019703 [Carnegiea gigantea]|uniref:Protein kinase domain-containing protein n=1 Tax=Carnegiea gigantea TaxID=171969 RepID=A0A9Q1QNH7_9CARY|nr:hypothetical protein Cgig2_019703 [Carnegiea gigantea]